MFEKIRDKFSEIWYQKYLEMCCADWDFYINSTQENMEKMTKAQDNYSNLFKDENFYNEFKKIDKNNLNPHQQKQLKNILKDFEEELNTGDDLKQLRNKENEIAQKYNSYVLKIDDKEVSRVDIQKILQTETNPEIRKKAYEANIKAADLIAEDLKEFAKMRNAFALKKGFSNYFEYKLAEDYEVDMNDLSDLLEEVYSKSKDVIKTIIEDKQNELKKFFGVNELKSYHYGLLLDNDPAKKVNECFRDKEQIVEISKTTYKNMGYDVDKLLEEGKLTLDLFPRKGKNTHGFCFDIDAGKDARILANLTNNTRSLDTLNHEMGHCVYALGISRDLPFIDRQTYPAMTEAVAMMMGDLQKRENILKNIVPDDILEEFKQTFRKDEANFIAHSQVIINFEKEMYKNPEQDLKQLWHDLKVKYLLRYENEEPDNGWASIPHYLSHPAYYQNYFRATLIKAQIYNHLENLTDNPNTSSYLEKNLFQYGTSMEENELIERLTGKKLSADDFVKSIL
ncbi:MAG: M2 family metallopeptidase [Candidatus Gastranaerophilales bacterium]|nr:M2 family metallopeptidase [Candidatus Gastranaerophilales bacterium]MCM1073653.1 M2 family metallopeptidase [Bacteroides sp.]